MRTYLSMTVDEIPSNFIITIPEIGIVKVCEKRVQEFTATLFVAPIIELFIIIFTGLPVSPILV